MPWSTWKSVLSPITGGDVSLDALIDTAKVTYNYELPFKSYVNFSFDTAKAAGSVLGARAFDDLQKQCARNALSYVSAVTGIQFNELPAGSTQNTDLVFVYADYTGTYADNLNMKSNDFTEYAVGYDAGGNIAALDVRDTIVMSSQYDYMQNLQAGYEGYEGLLREIGHALGLKYPSSGSPNLPSEMDNTAVTRMSLYYVPPNRSEYSFSDLKALNWLYGGDGLLGRWGLTVDGSGNPAVVPFPLASASGAALLAQAG